MRLSKLLELSDNSHISDLLVAGPRGALKGGATSAWKLGTQRQYDARHIDGGPLRVELQAVSKVTGPGVVKCVTPAHRHHNGCWDSSCIHVQKVDCMFMLA